MVDFIPPVFDKSIYNYLYKTWIDKVKANKIDDYFDNVEVSKTFNDAGYYKFDFKNMPGLGVIVLNSNYFTLDAKLIDKNAADL